MSASDESPAPPDHLPDTLVERPDSLGILELKAVLSDVEQRIESIHTPIEEEIEMTTTSEILDIENHGAYALMRKRPPNPDGLGANTDITSLSHLKREQQLGGEESPHWAYPDDVRNSGQIRRETRGRTLDKDATVYPHCGSNEIGDSKTED